MVTRTYFARKELGVGARLDKAAVKLMIENLGLSVPEKELNMRNY